MTSVGLNICLPRSSAATPVPENRRMDFLPGLFGPRYFLTGEVTVYNFMARLSPHDYGGGTWEFCERNSEPLYLYPTSKERYRIICDTNGYEGDVSAEAAGIIATLFALSHLSFACESERMSEQFGKLYAYAADHPEAGEIFRAID